LPFLKNQLIGYFVCTIAIYYKLFTIEELISVLKNKPDETEIIITGRYAPPELTEIADLVT
jgi:cob(I)alamin adenosyltransferase